MCVATLKEDEEQPSTAWVGAANAIANTNAQIRGSKDFLIGKFNARNPTFDSYLKVTDGM